MYFIFLYFLLYSICLICSSESKTPPNRTVNDVLHPMTFQEMGQNIIQNFINKHENPQTAMNIIHELMTARDESHSELCAAIGRDPNILTAQS